MKKFLAAMILMAGSLFAQTVHFPGKETNNIFTGTDQFTQGVLLGPVTFAGLPAAPPNGTSIYCIDCLNAAPCAAGGSGAFANRVNGAWQCTGGGGGGSGNATSIQGTPVNASAPTLNQALIFDGSLWSPTTISSAVVDSSIEITPHKDQLGGYLGIDALGGSEIQGDLTVDGNLLVAGPWLITTTLPVSPMVAAPPSESSFGVNTDGNFYISANAGPPAKILTDGFLSSASPFPQVDYNNVKYQTAAGLTSAEVHTGANAEQFVFTSSPAGTVSIGANTVTLAPVPCGVNGADTFHYLYIAGTGTPEVVKITGGTAVSCGASGTITFTAVNAHSAGFTVQSATAGVAEALKYVLAQNSGMRVFLPPGSLNTFRGPLYVTSNGIRDNYNTTLDFTGAVISCTYTGASCINLGDPAGSSNANQMIRVLNPAMQACAAIGDSTHHYAAIEDNAASSSIYSFRVIQRCGVGNYFRDLIVNDNDQNLTLFDMKLEGDAQWGHCDTDWCSNAVFGPGGGASFAGITRLTHADLSLACNGNGVDDHNANNSISIIDSVIQAYAQFAARFSSGVVTLANVYTEGGGCTNPIYGSVTQAGFIVNGGEVHSSGGSGPSSVNPTFTNNAAGGTTYSYFLVYNNGSAKSNPLYLGKSAVNSGTVTSITVKWPGTNYFSGAITTFDLLRVSALTTIPVGTANYAVSTGITVGSACTTNVCTFTDTNAALGSYTVVNNLSPVLTYLPGALVSTSSQDRTGAASDFGVYRGRQPGGDGWINNTLPVMGAGGGGNFAGGQNIFIDPVSLLSGMNWTGPMPLFLDQTGGAFPQPLMLTNGRTSGDADGLMGRAIITAGRLDNGDLITLDDTAPAATTSAQNRLAARDADAALCKDALVGLCVRASTSGSFSVYVGHAPSSGDTAYKLRVDGSNITFKEPMTTNSQITSTLAPGTAPMVVASTTPVPNLAATPITYNHSGTQFANSHVVIDTCTLGSNCGVTLTGAAVFTNSTSYQCSVVDVTSASAAKFVASSGSAFTLTGTGTDVLAYTCIGD